jgi:CRISPR-associated protein Cas2
MFLYIVAYDIPSNRRRKKVSDILEGYGRRVQYSVFELVLVKSKYDEMRRRFRVSARKTSINCAIGQADLRQGQ